MGDERFADQGLVVMENKKEKVPITLLSGFLGSGKSTLLRRILEEEHGMKVAVIQNEANNLGLEQMTAVSEEGKETQEWIDLPNGCVCCTVKDDLLVTLEQLLEKQPFQHIVIEMSGLADPGPLIQVFWADSELEANVYLDAVVCVCDAQHITDHLNSTQEASQQIAMADRVLLNKCDLVEEAKLAEVEARLKSINAAASVMRTVQSEADLTALLHVNAFDAQGMAERLRSDASQATVAPIGQHTKTIETRRIHIPGLLDKSALRNFLATLLWEADEDYDVLRLKGLISLAGKRVKYALQGVRDVWSLDKTSMPLCQETEPVSQFVFIGRDMLVEQWEKELLKCVHKE